MAEKLYMIALSPTMTDGVIARWKLAEGASMKPGVVVCEVETDKATMDYEAPKTATLLKIVVPQGGKAAVGDVIGVIGAAGESPDAILAELASGAAKPAAAAQAASPVSPAPQAGRSPAAAAGAASAAPAGPTPAAGAPGSSPAVRTEPAGAGAHPQPTPARGSGAAQAIAGAPLAPIGVPPSSPLARTRARELGVDIRLVAGSGPEGRVIVRDVEEAARSGGAALGSLGAVAAPAAQSAPAGAFVPAGSGLRNESVAVAGKRAVIARRLAESFFQAPHFYLKKTVDSGRLLGARQAINAERGARISLNAWLMKLAALAIARNPSLNAGWKQDAEGRAIIEYRASVDIGLAVALSDGLITPVVRDCLGKGVAAIDAELAALIAKAKSGGLAPEDYSGASFTITNLGSFGIDEFTAIINPPGSAILAVGASRKEPYVREDESIGVRTAMTLTLGCDHRVVDGAVGAAFLADLAKAIEEPLTALL